MPISYTDASRYTVRSPKYNMCALAVTFEFRTRARRAPSVLKILERRVALSNFGFRNVNQMSSRISRSKPCVSLQ